MAVKLLLELDRILVSGRPNITRRHAAFKKTDARSRGRFDVNDFEFTKKVREPEVETLLSKRLTKHNYNFALLLDEKGKIIAGTSRRLLKTKDAFSVPVRIDPDTITEERWVPAEMSLRSNAYQHTKEKVAIGSYLNEFDIVQTTRNHNREGFSGTELISVPILEKLGLRKQAEHKCLAIVATRKMNGLYAVAGLLLNGDPTVVDEFIKSHGEDTASIYALDERISTNMLKEKSSARLYGSKAPSEVRKVVLLQGKEFWGKIVTGAKVPSLSPSTMGSQAANSQRSLLHFT